MGNKYKPMTIPDDFNLKSEDGHVYAKSPNHPGIRVRKVCYHAEGEYFQDYYFEIFTKPFWFGWFRKKRWEMSIQTNSFKMGLDFSKHLLK